MSRAASFALLCVAWAAVRGASPPPESNTPEVPAPAAIELAVSPSQATVGDPIEATLALTLAAGIRVRTEPLPTELGPFLVGEQHWSGPESTSGAGLLTWRWSGKLSAFRTGELEIPSIDVHVELGDGRTETLSTAPRRVTITSVLDPAESTGKAAPEIADLKPPASLAPDHSALWIAGGVLAVLLAAAGLLWWLNRRFAKALAAVPPAIDPFERTPPHVWVYAELQKLLERRLAEQGHIDLFFAELSRILKRYLGGRFRVELMERTTEEVPPLLRQAGAAERAISAAGALFARCDRVKFAGEEPEPPACRQAIEEAYAIVDATRPREEHAPAERGAA